MCGIAGVYALGANSLVEASHLESMIKVLKHRGPDQSRVYTDKNVGLAFSRLAIIDLTHGMQPFISDDGTVVSMCNGEIFNYKELKLSLRKKGYSFKTECDAEVVIPLYREYGLDCFNKINGQFSIAIFDKKRKHLVLARDHFGICPLYYTIVDNHLIFASEIKAILSHPIVTPQANLTGLDQILTFPGLVSPMTMFKNIFSVKPGNFLVAANDNNVVQKKYWDINYPEKDSEYIKLNEQDYIDELDRLFTRSVSRRLRSDVPVGVYLSGGIDSTLVLAKAKKLLARRYEIKSFSIEFTSKYESEAEYQNIAVKRYNTDHHRGVIDDEDILNNLNSIVYHSEQPLKETFDTASLALAKLVNEQGLKVVLGGQGADELFGGYVGYIFDQTDYRRDQVASEQERLIQKKLWGQNFVYEKNYHPYEQVKLNLLSNDIKSNYQSINCLNHPVIDRDQVNNRSILAVRSYVDLKLRLADHLLTDHGDRMSMAHSVEVRYPFLDIDLANFVMRLPDELKVKGTYRKYILRKMAQKYVPDQIVKREKQGFAAPGSPGLLRKSNEFINDMLSYERIKKQGYFNPNVVEELKKQYAAPGFRIKVPFETDLLIIVLTFSIWKDLFKVPNL